MSSRLILVKAAFDSEVRVWYIESSDLPGLNIEADTLDALAEKLPAAVLDLVQEGGIDGDEGWMSGGEREVPIELVAHLSTRLRIPAGA